MVCAVTMSSLIIVNLVVGTLIIRNNSGPTFYILPLAKFKQLVKILE